jgi:AcrR family transcriptional regulator
MGRWAPDARGRLLAAAFDLFSERGFEKVTVEEIAQRAGLTERTFFRYFSDKREVLFWGAQMLQDLLVQGVDDAPEELVPLETVEFALLRAAEQFFDGSHEFAKHRQAIIASNPELQERELIKLASLSSALAQALGRRHVSDPTATLAAELGIVIFKTAFVEWVNDSSGKSLSQLVHAHMAELEGVTGGSSARRDNRQPSM